MYTQYSLLIACLIIVPITSCNLNNANDPDNGDRQDPATTKFKNVTATHLPREVRTNNVNDVAVSDLDGDNAPDLVLAVENRNNQLLFNEGNGTFTLPAEQSSEKGFDSEQVTITDFNNDTKPDLFFANDQDRVNELYLNQGNGRFLDASGRIPVTGRSLSAIHIDLFDDGDQDIIIGNNGQNTLITNNGNGYFSAVPELLPNNSGVSHDLAAGDINGDGMPDLVLGNEISTKILINVGPDFFSNQTTERLPLIGDIEETRDVELADLNNDQALDIYFANVGFEPGSDATNRLLLNDGSGVFSDSTNTHLPPLNSNTTAAEIKDLNGDDAPDIITGSYNGGLNILINDGNAQFTVKTGSWIPDEVQSGVQDLVAADLNDDYRPDLYVCRRGEASDLLLLQKTG